MWLGLLEGVTHVGMCEASYFKALCMSAINQSTAGGRSEHGVWLACHMGHACGGGVVGLERKKARELVSRQAEDEFEFRLLPINGTQPDAGWLDGWPAGAEERGSAEEVWLMMGLGGGWVGGAGMCSSRLMVRVRAVGCQQGASS